MVAMAGRRGFVVEREQWMLQAACRGVDTDLFFSSDVSDIAQAKAICAKCPVAAECRAFRRKTKSVGVWGGVAVRPDEDRRQTRKEREAAARLQANANAS